MRSLIRRLHRLEAPGVVVDASNCPRCRVEGPPIMRFLIRESKGDDDLPHQKPPSPMGCALCGTSPRITFSIEEALPEGVIR